MLIINCPEYLAEVREFAKNVDAYDALQKQLVYLNGYGNPDNPWDGYSRCVLSKDFAPYSFAFTMQRKSKDGEYDYWFSGGLIYSGPGQPADGSSPSLSVSLDPDASSGKKHMWSVHT